MWPSTERYKKYAGILALVISIFSIGAIVSIQCHNEQSTHAGTAGSHHDETTAASSTSQSDFVEEICVGFAFILLLVIRKFFWLGRGVNDFRRLAIRFSGEKIRAAHQNLFQTLSFYQRGVIRI